MSPDQLACLDAMGIDVWVRRDLDLSVADTLPTTELTGSFDPVRLVEPSLGSPQNTDPATPQKTNEASMGRAAAIMQPTSQHVIKDDRLERIESDNWESLRQRVAACTQCSLHESRTQTVFGVGDQQADWMIIGEAPGAEEDKQGEPFVGRAGMLLNGMLRAVGLKRNQVYIANILKCRPPGNRDPHATEVEQCESYLARQIALLKPRLILCVGRIAAHNLLKTTTPLSRLRGRAHVYGETGIPVIVTYHPAYLLRTPTDKRKAWEDLCLAQSLLSED